MSLSPNALYLAVGCMQLCTKQTSPRCLSPSLIDRSVSCVSAFFQVAINTTITDVNQFLEHIITSTNMKCLTPPRALEGDCGFVAANLYARSVFGEDALVNVSVEATAEGKLQGYIRIRSKTQGIALSLGDKITLKQKG